MATLTRQRGGVPHFARHVEGPGPTRRPPEGHRLLDIQRSHGNSAVARMVAVQRKQTTGLLFKGSTGAKVKRVQEQLNALGFPVATPDGDFGPRTDTAVRGFQQAHNLKPDGIVGEFTRTMLDTEHAHHGNKDGSQPCHTPEEPGPDTAFETPGGGGERPVVFAVGDKVGDGPGQPAGVKVVIRLSRETNPNKAAADDAEVAAFGGIPETALSIGQLQAVLAKHPRITSLALLSHGTIAGKIFIGNTEITLNELAAQIAARPAGSIGSVVFLGCNIGNDKPGLSQVKTKLGAKSAEGASCNLDTRVASPVRDAKGRDLKSVNDIIKAGERDPVEAIRRNAKKILGNRTGCILGFSPAETIDSVPDEKIKKAYDDHQGVLTAKFNPSGDCWENLKYDEPDVGGCKRVQA